MPALYAALDLQKNELRQAQVQNLGSAPGSPVKGQLYFNSTAGDNTLYWYDGTSWQAAKATATVPMSDSVSTLAIGGAPAAGASTTASRGDHSHGLPAFGSVTAAISFNTTANDGTAATIARSDHRHGTPSLGISAPVTQAIGDAAGAGSAVYGSHEDHKHGMPAFGGVTAQTAFGSTSNNGSAASLARSDHAHGTPTHDATAHSTIPLNSFAAATGTVDLGGQRIVNLNNPISGSDGASKNYVDNAISGLSWKDSCRAASTANIASLNGTMTLDGVALNAGERVLVKDQTTASQNGIYLVTPEAGPGPRTWLTTRRCRAPGGLRRGRHHQRRHGVDVHHQPPITLDTTSLTFVQFAAGAATSRRCRDDPDRQPAQRMAGHRAAGRADTARQHLVSPRRPRRHRRLRDGEEIRAALPAPPRRRPSCTT